MRRWLLALLGVALAVGGGLPWVPWPFVFVGVAIVVVAVALPDRPPPPNSRDVTLRLERDAGLVFDGVFLLPGYYVYEKRWEQFGFECRECGGGTYYTYGPGKRRCRCGGRDIDRDDLGWLVHPEIAPRIGFRVTPANERA